MNDKSKLTVSLGEQSYPIHIGAGSFDVLRQTIADLRAARCPVALITDTRVAAAQATVLESLGFEPRERFIVPNGEGSKSIEQYSALLEWLAGNEVSRDGAIFAFGGGVVGDLAGFVAASYLRGLRFYQIPTTLLAMVDSSVGGKTGINLSSGKNLVGAFWQPEAVFIETATLGTLPEREFSAGMAEVIKYGMLCDHSLFATLEGLPKLQVDSAKLPAIIRRCCELKAEIVGADEKETASEGGRALLNLGHTFAHAIENVAGYGAYLHGEAVAIGLVCATRLALEEGCLDQNILLRVGALLERYALPQRVRENLRTEALLEAMRKDKKNIGGKLRLISMRTLGEACILEGVSETRVRGLWKSAGAV